MSIYTPPGYKLSWSDNFQGETLNDNIWNKWLGANQKRWDNKGQLPLPFSGPNVEPDMTQQSMYSDSQVHVNNGLTLLACKNTNQYKSEYPWISGCLTSKLWLPTSQWYYEVEAKFSGSDEGEWGAIWNLPGPAGATGPELDVLECGWLARNPNLQGHSEWFGNTKQQVWAMPNGGSITDWHTYGAEFIRGKGITCYVDGTPVFNDTTSIAGGPYEIILELQIASTNTHGWHTIPTATTDYAAMWVSEVAAYVPN